MNSVKVPRLLIGNLETIMSTQDDNNTPSLATRLRKIWNNLPPIVWRVLASAFFAGMGLRLNWLFLNFHLEELQFSRELIGYANAVPAVSMILLGVPAGIYAPRFGYVNSLRFAGLTAGASLLLVGWAPSTAVVFAGLFGFGLGNSLIMATMPPLLQKLTPEAKRVLAFSWYGGLGTGAGFIGNLGGGYLPQWLGGVDGVIFLMAAIFVLTLVPLWRLSEERGRVDKQFRIRNWKMWGKLLLPNMIIGFGAGAVMPFLNLYLADKFGLSFETIGFIFSISALATTLTIMIQPYLVGLWGKVGAVAATQTTALPFILVIAYVPFLPLVTLAMFVREAMMNAANPIYTALAMDKLAEEEAAAYMIAMNVSWRIAWAISSSVSGNLQERLGVEAFNYLFAAMLFLYGTSICLLLFFFWGTERPEGEKLETAEVAGS